MSAKTIAELSTAKPGEFGQIWALWTDGESDGPDRAAVAVLRRPDGKGITYVYCSAAGGQRDWECGPYGPIIYGHGQFAASAEADVEIRATVICTDERGERFALVLKGGAVTRLAGWPRQGEAP